MIIFLPIYVTGCLTVALLCGVGNVDERDTFWATILWPVMLLAGVVALPIVGCYRLGQLISSRK